MRFDRFCCGYDGALHERALNDRDPSVLYIISLKATLVFKSIFFFCNLFVLFALTTTCFFSLQIVASGIPSCSFPETMLTRIEAVAALAVYHTTAYTNDPDPLHTNVHSVTTTTW